MNKEQLIKLLDYVRSAASKQGNEWFLKELQKKYGVSTESDIETRLKNIEIYLQIDGIEIIDYSEIKDNAIREQLTRDCIEMHRHRLGKVNHKIDFDEFCRYAHYQAEEMINYYLNKRFSKNITEIVHFLKTFLAEDDKKSFFRKDITSIEYRHKLKCLRDKNNKYYNTLLSVKKLRDKISHRNSLDSINEDDILNKANKIPSWKDWKDCTDEECGLRTVEKAIKFRRDQNFEKIIEALNELKEKIISELYKKA